jgi:hypothetical protein
MTASGSALPLLILVTCAIGAGFIAAGAAFMAFRLPCDLRREAVAACFAAFFVCLFCVQVARHPAFWVALP